MFRSGDDEDGDEGVREARPEQLRPVDVSLDGSRESGSHCRGRTFLKRTGSIIGFDRRARTGCKTGMSKMPRNRIQHLGAVGLVVTVGSAASSAAADGADFL